MESCRKRGRSDMWGHFKLIAPDKVQCFLCLGVYKYHGNTSSMIRHFSTQHGALVNQGNTNQVDQKQEQKQDQKQDQKQYQKQYQKQDQKQDQKQYQKQDQKQDPDEALVKMVVKESQPLSIVDSLLLSDSVEQPRKRGRSDMWEHFNLIPPDKVQCSVCLAKLKYHGNTSSMIRHYTTKHGAAVNQGKKNKDDRKRELDEALVNMLVKDSQPFSIVDDCGFKEFVALLDPTYTLPSPQTLEDMVIKRFNEQKTKVKDDVEGGHSDPNC